MQAADRAAGKRRAIAWQTLARLLLPPLAFYHGPREECHCLWQTAVVKCLWLRQAAKRLRVQRWPERLERRGARVQGGVRPAKQAKENVIRGEISQMRGSKSIGIASWYWEDGSGRDLDRKEASTPQQPAAGVLQLRSLQEPGVPLREWRLGPP